MTTLSKTQTCPYCGHDVDDPYAEWDEGTTTVECDRCKREYQVTTHYTFDGFEVKKYCTDCCEPEEDCYCGEEEHGQPK